MIDGYIDVQVNGYAGVDFNAEGLSPADIHRACLALRRDGVAKILATIITAPSRAMETRLKRLAQACASDPLVGDTIAGLHVEGPFISPLDGYRGAHPSADVRPASREVAERLLAAGNGKVRLVTLAPECDPEFKTITFLRQSGIRVAAGHTDAPLEVLREACDAGVSLFTHLGNGCPAEMPRHDNIVQRALALREHLSFSFIADGAHIPFWTLRNYLSLVGLERVIVTTDAMAAAAMGPGRYAIGHLRIEVGEDRVARQPGSSLLAGSAVTMSISADNLARHLDFSPEQIRRTCIVNPGKIIGD